MDANAWLLLLQGAWVTLWISALSIVLGIALGLVVALLRAARVLSSPRPWPDTSAWPGPRRW